MNIRAETSADHGSIRTLNRIAFGGEYEAALIERLRAEELIRASLVAIDDEQLIGHILFSAISVIVDGWGVRAAALAPMAVTPKRQRQGVGSALVRTGLDQLAAQGFEAVIVLGHPAYYPRFGFSPATVNKLEAPYSGEAFMALELTADALAGMSGTVTYPDAFDPD
ncbi:N-acetyltransferase [Emcibacter sp. SYSU 3D8]|uniref:GNAT family N-acetyltransferase n=1 Tax=Emcibacter sp. SYSU 3D8 TaxID=3133969 RepID=UPI0031FF1179